MRHKKFLQFGSLLIMRSQVVAVAMVGLASTMANDAYPHDASGHATPSTSSSAEKRALNSIGTTGHEGEANRTIEIEMDDTMKFRPAVVSVRAGETVRFRMHNRGRAVHEFVMGSIRDLGAHAKMMEHMPGMEHSAPNMLTLAPGRDGELIWKFTQPGIVHFACLQPGHFAAGMKGEIRVRSQKTSPGSP